MMQKLTQVSAGLRLGRFGPEEKCQVLAGLWGTGVQHQKGQQRLQAVCADRVEGLLPDEEAECSQELDSNRGHI